MQSMQRRTDRSDLDIPAAVQHRTHRDLRPRARRPRDPDLSRRNAFEVRVAETMACRTHEELEELERQRNEDAAREPIEDGIEGARL